jgi:lysophospholipase L1-like esterase
LGGANTTLAQLVTAVCQQARVAALGAAGLLAKAPRAARQWQERPVPAPDRSTKGRTDFRAAYGIFVGTVRTAYMSAKIAALRPYNGAHSAEIQAEVKARAAAGDAHIFFIDTSGWLGNADFTDGVHPDAQGSTKAATALHSLGLL